MHPVVAMATNPASPDFVGALVDDASSHVVVKRDIFNPNRVYVLSLRSDGTNILKGPGTTEGCSPILTKEQARELAQYLIKFAEGVPK